MNINIYQETQNEINQMVTGKITYYKTTNISL